MFKVLLRFLNYILGGVIGYVLGLFLTPMVMYVVLPHTNKLILLITTLMGLLVSMIYVEHQNAIAIRRSKDVYDEAVALITHEMRTGLTSTGWALLNILEKYKAAIDPKDAEMLQDVYDSIHTTVMHSVDLLDTSMEDTGKLIISLEWQTLLKVDTMFKETLDKYKPGAERNKINLISNIVLDPKREVEVDMTRLRIILENLLENAFQYTKGDIREIKVDITNNATQMVMKVSDTGVGIPDSEKPKIFSEFYRATNARKMLSSGSGIGLYLCAKYAKAHRGKIWFESTEGKGSTFSVSIPLKTTADVNEFLNRV